MLTGIRIFEIEFPPGFCQALEIGVSLANDGFEIDRRDQEMRGPGEFLGVQQSGTPLLHLAELETDAELLEWTLALAPQMRDRHPTWPRSTCCAGWVTRRVPESLDL